MNTNKLQYTPNVILNSLNRFKTIAFFALLAVILTTVSCAKDDDKDPIVTYVATLDGASEAIPNSSAATGNANLKYNTDTKKFTIVVNYTGVTATGAHIHKGAVGTAGGVVFPLASPITSPITYTSDILTAEQLSDLNAGLYYVNIHSAAFPDGEIRGQLKKQ